MAYLVIENFVGGLDTRRNILTSKPGNLVRLDNCHITRGGEIERRKAFQIVGVIPEGTYGLEACGEQLFVFGSIPTPPNLPSALTYQRLTHPDGGSFYMTKVVSFTSYAGKPFVIAEFNDGARYCFYDGVIVDDSVNGIYRASHVDLRGFLNSVADLLPSNFTSVVSPTGITVIGPPGMSFTLAAVSNGNLSASASQTSQTAVKPIPEVLSKGSFIIGSGSSGAGSCERSLRYGMEGLPGITGIYVNGTEILGLASPAFWNTIPEHAGGEYNGGPRMAWTLCTLINATTATTGISAGYAYQKLSGTDAAKLTIYSDPLKGASQNGVVVRIEFASHLTANELVSNVGTSPYDVDPSDPNYQPTRHIGDFAAFSGAADNQVSSVKVDGVEILGTPIPWRTSNSATAQAVADQINSYTSTVEYSASVIDGGKVVLRSQAGSGASQNGKAVSISTAGTVLVNSVVWMSGGVDPIGGVSQRSSFGVTENGDKIGSTLGITIIDQDNVEYPYHVGATAMAGLDLNYCFTYKSKVNILADSYLIGSELDNPRNWKAGALGVFFIDMSNNINGSEHLMAAAPYQGKLAVFTRASCQIWNIDPDPQNNSISQIIMNSGTIAPNSVIGYGEIDVFYLSDAGIRSLRARDASSQAMVHDVGVNIDTQVVELLHDIPGSVSFNSFSVIEPNDNRLMMSIYDKTFVLSQYPSASINAWSTYTPDNVSNKMAVFDGSVWSRQSNVLYVYGGMDGITYDDCVSDIILPYLDGTKAATMKHLMGIDLTSDGNWDFYVGTDPYAPDVRDHVATISNSTFLLGRVPAVGIGTHIGVRLVSIGSGYGRIGNLILHYELNESE